MCQEKIIFYFYFSLFCFFFVKNDLYSMNIYVRPSPYSQVIIVSLSVSKCCNLDVSVQSKGKRATCSFILYESLSSTPPPPHKHGIKYAF